MTHNLTPDTGDSIALQLDQLVKSFRLPNALESITVGRLFLQLKEETPHGNFMDRVKSLGLESTSVTRYMACARLLDSDHDAALLTTVKSRGKLFELLVLEPVEIEALRLGKKVRGLTLERLESMTVLELRGALRQWREDVAQEVDEAISKKLSTLKIVTSQPLKASEEPVQPSESSSPALDTGESVFSQLNEHGRIFSLGNAVEGLTAGNLLLQAQAAVPDARTFKKRAKLLGFEDSAAAAYMACARIFDLEIDAPLVAAAKSISKLRELLILDAEEVEALNQGEEVRGLTLQRIALMTVQQLREALGKEPSPALKLKWEEETLLFNYRKCSPQARAHVAQAAELLAGR